MHCCSQQNKIRLADIGSVSPTPLTKVKEIPRVGVQDSVSASEQRLVISLSNSVSPDELSSEMASLKTSNTGVSSSHESTAGVFTSSFATETATTAFAKSFLAMVESISLSASPFTSSYTKSSLVFKESVSSEETIISTGTFATFSKSTESTWNYTESYSKGKVTGIFTASFHKSDAAISRTTVYLSTIVSVSLYSTHSSNHLSTQTSAVEESSVTGYLTTKLSTSETPVIAYSPTLGTRQLSNRTSTKMSGPITSTYRITDMEKSEKTSAPLVSSTYHMPDESVPMATSETQNEASSKLTNSSHALGKSSLFSSKLTSEPLQSETLQRSVITTSKFPHLSNSSSALDSASREISSGHNKITVGVSVASLLTSLSRSSLANPVWYKTEILRYSSSSKGNNRHVETTSLVLASGLKENLKSSSSSLMPKITLLLTSTWSSSSSSSSTMISTLSSPPVQSSSFLVLPSLSLKLRSTPSSSSSLSSSSSVLTHTAALPILVTPQLSFSILPSNSSRLLLSSAQSTPSISSLPLTFSVTNAVSLTQQSHVQPMSHSPVTLLSGASTSPLQLRPLSSKQLKLESTVASLSLPLSSFPSTSFQVPLRIRTTSLSTSTPLQTANISLFLSTSSSSSSFLTTTRKRTTTTPTSPAAVLKPSSPTLSPLLLSLQLSITASLPSVSLGSVSTSLTAKMSSLPLLPSSVSSLSSLSSPLSLYRSSTPLLTTTSKLKLPLSRFPTLPLLTLNVKTSLMLQRTTHSSFLLTSLRTKSSRSSETLGNLSYTGTKVAPSNNLPTLESSSSRPSAALPVVNKTFLVKFHANCSAITAEDVFKSSFITTLTYLLKISKSDVIVHDVICGSVDVLFVIKSAPGRNLTNELWAAIKNESFFFTYNLTKFVAFELREISRPSVTPTTSPASPSTTSNNDKHERKKMVFIIFVFIGSVFVALFIFLLVVFLARFSRCCRRTVKLRVRRNGRFHVPMESELTRFAVRRSLFQGVNFYGDITQLEEMKQDAEIVEDDIDVEGEFSEIHPVDTNTCLLNGSSHRNSHNVEEHKFVFDDDDSISSVLFY